MKKTILTALVVVAIASASCRKERTCECKTTTTTVTTGYGAGTDVETTSTKLTEAKQYKTDFKLMTNCVSTKESHTENDGTGLFAHTDMVTEETTCDLK